MPGWAVRGHTTSKENIQGISGTCNKYKDNIQGISGDIQQVRIISRGYQGSYNITSKDIRRRTLAEVTDNLVTKGKV